MRSLLPTLLILTASALAPAQGQAVEDWTRTVTLLGSQIYGAMVARDGADALYVAGHYPRDRIVTAKFAADGTPKWQQTFTLPTLHFEATWITVDPFGDVLVTGNQVTASSTQPIGFVVLKYDAAGNLLWSDVVSGVANTLARVAADANGDVVVGGVAPALATGGLVRKYSRTGAPQWNAAVPGRVNALAIDPAGTIHVAANAAVTMTVQALSSTGATLWTHTQPNATGSTDVVLGPGGEVYASGALRSATTQDLSLILKLSAGGALLWAQSYPGTQARRIAVDRRGDIVFVAGLSPSGGYFDWVTRKVTPAGTSVWATVYNQHAFNSEVPNALVVGPDDEIYVTGSGGPGPTSGTLSYVRQVTVRYSRNGVQEWAASSFTSTSGVGLVLQADGSVATVGDSTFTLFHYLQRGVWRSIGGELGGLSAPRLEGEGSPAANAPIQTSLTGGLPNVPTWLVIGFSRVGTPLFGGTLVPAPDIVLGGATDGSGSQLTPFVWPTGLPLGLEITAQSWIADPGAPFGLAATNALVAVSG